MIILINFTSTINQINSEGMIRNNWLSDQMSVYFRSFLLFCTHQLFVAIIRVDSLFSMLFPNDAST